MTWGSLFLVGMAISCSRISPHAVCGLRTHGWGPSPSHASTCRLKSSPGQQCGKLLKNGKSGKRMLICCCSVPRHPSASPPPVSPDLTPTLGVAGRYRLCGYRETRSKLSHSLTRVGESLRSLLSSSSGKSGQWGHCEN